MPQARLVGGDDRNAEIALQWLDGFQRAESTAGYEDSVGACRERVACLPVDVFRSHLPLPAEVVDLECLVLMPTRPEVEAQLPGEFEALVGEEPFGGGVTGCGEPRRAHQVGPADVERLPGADPCPGRGRDRRAVG